MRFYILDDEKYLKSIVKTNDSKYIPNENYTTLEPTLLTDKVSRFINGEWIYENKPIITTPNETLREQSYETLKCITWESTEITVDEANKLFLNYFAENNPKANEIQPLIIEAKEYIRTLYPDEV